MERYLAIIEDLVDSQYKIYIHQTDSTRGFKSFIGGIHSQLHQVQSD